MHSLIVLDYNRSDIIRKLLHQVEVSTSFVTKALSYEINMFGPPKEQLKTKLSRNVMKVGVKNCCS